MQVCQHINDLGSAFQYRFGRNGDLADLENAISNLQRAVKLTAHGHADMPARLNNLGNTFVDRFGRTGDLADLENAIFNVQRAIELTPHGHADMFLWLNNLGNAFQSRFGRTSDLADLDNAMSTLLRAIKLTPYNHAGMSVQFNNLGILCYKYFQHTQNPEHLLRALFAYRLSATHITGAPSVRFHAARSWSDLAPSFGSVGDTLEAFRTAVELLSQVAGLDQTVSKRYKNLADVSHLTTSASAAAIDAGENETALEWLEQGRCLVWNQIQ